jgi:hypothetical protein
VRSASQVGTGWPFGCCHSCRSTEDLKSKARDPQTVHFKWLPIQTPQSSSRPFLVHAPHSSAAADTATTGNYGDAHWEILISGQWSVLSADAVRLFETAYQTGGVKVVQFAGLGSMLLDAAQMKMTSVMGGMDIKLRRNVSEPLCSAVVAVVVSVHLIRAKGRNGSLIRMRWIT